MTVATMPWTDSGAAVPGFLELAVPSLEANPTSEFFKDRSGYRELVQKQR